MPVDEPPGGPGDAPSSSVEDPTAGTRRIRLLIRYDGTGYFGWQRQPARRTVQGEVERAAQAILRDVRGVHGSGRTDAGVHALGQVAHLDTSSPIPAASIPRALNSALPDDISILAAAEVDPGFHARFSVRRKTYVYRVHVAAERDALRDRYSLRVRRPPDVPAMRAAARVLVGRHDFRSFTTGAAAREDTVRELLALRVRARGDAVAILATADGFLQHMVRNLTGLLLRIGDGAAPVEAAAAVLAARDRSMAPPALPSRGLFLWRVDY